MDADKTNTKIKIIQKQSTSSDSNVDIRFKEHLERLKVKVKMINDKPSTMELIYGYISINIGPLIF